MGISIWGPSSMTLRGAASARLVTELTSYRYPKHPADWARLKLLAPEALPLILAPRPPPPPPTAQDLGADSYNLPGYFGRERWDYYRLNSLGHSVPIFGNESQTHPVAAPITAFNATGVPPKDANISLDGFAVVDLTAAYATSAGAVSARRGFVSLTGSAALVIVDEFIYNNQTRPANVTWRVHTRAAAAQITRVEVGLDWPRAQLAVLQSTSCMDSFGGFTVTDATTLLPDPPFNSAKGLSRVEALFSSPSPACSTLAFAVGGSAIVSQLLFGYPAIRPIDAWATLGPLDYSQ